MSESVTSMFESGLERYQAGENPQQLIPVFKEICDRAPKHTNAWICLAWLYLLADKPDRAIKAAQKSVKLSPRDPQARINLALAILDAGKKGVREHVEVARESISLDKELRGEIEENIQDGLNRKPDWKSLERVKSWLIN
ncbi:MAG: tetratricopeptide repeat protein [Prochloraceae cyanobacterium]|nr:tetratricopeptide repeat protein [Prochloraceae cyanobacterium]